MNKLGWLWYPVGVAVFIAMSAMFVFRPETIERLSFDAQQAEENRKKAEVLKKKLEVLSAVNPAVEIDRLRFLNSAVPPTKMIWHVVAQMELAASEAGAVLSEYSAGVGTGLTEGAGEAKLATEASAGEELTVKATVRFKDSDDLKPFFAALAKRLPLVMTTAAMYETGTMNLSLISAWGANKKLASSDELPDYKMEVETAIRRLEGFVAFPEVTAGEVGEGGQTVNPF